MNNPIKKLTIKNYRSIEIAEIDLNQLTVLIGDNDVGKSNVLRAMNLFFNGKTDIDMPFDFDRDYCNFAITGLRKAKEIVIELTLTPPENYSNSKDIVWKKIWRKDGLHADKEIIKYVDGNEISSRSKLYTWLYRIKFKYIPAIKDKNYFNTLMTDLYASLSATVSSEIKRAANSFTKQVNSHTGSILSDVLSKLGIDSSIDLPDDLGEIFRSLAFRSKDNGVVLDQRGDGIKVRHIPIILKYLASQDNFLRDKGSPSFTHIWGYEEPENNLEMRRSFALADDFIEYSKNIQIILTSHAPSFYNIVKNQSDKTNLFLSEKPYDSVVFKHLLKDELDQLDGLMGLMPAIAPHIELINKKLDNAEKNVKKLGISLINNNKPRLYVEGYTDKLLFKKTVDIYFPWEADKFLIECADESGGATWVADKIISAKYSRSSIKFAGLLDKDRAGNEAKARINRAEKLSSEKLIKCFQLPTISQPLQIIRSGLAFEYGLEELMCADVWQHAFDNGWLKDRGNIILLNADKLDKNTSIQNLIDSKNLDEITLLILNNTVAIENKEKFTKYAIRHATEENNYLINYKKITSEIINFLLE